MRLPQTRLALVLLPLLLSACSEPATELAQTPTTPSAEVASQHSAAVLPPLPRAEPRPFEVKAPHGATRLDEYYWLRDDARKNPQMLDYLKAENAFTDALMSPLKPLSEKLYAEITGRIKQDDSSVPYQENDYWYYTRFEEGRDYPIHARRKGSMDAAEEILLDLNALAEGKGFYQVATREISPDQQSLLYAEDAVGRRQWVLRVKNLATGETLPDQVSGSSASAVWADDGRSFYYVENDPITLLSKRVKRHVLGTDPASDSLVYEEADDSFYMGLYRTRSERFICIHVQSTVSSEARCTEGGKPEQFRVLAARERDFEYQADHLGERWVIRNNAAASNFKLSEASTDAVFDRAAWRDLLPHDEAVFIEGSELFDDFIVIAERSDGLSRIRILPNAGEARHVAADEPAYSMDIDVNAEPATDWLRYRYTSLATPASVYELNVKSGERRLLKQDEVLGGFDSANYVVERVWAPARDGVKVPVSLVYRKGLLKDGTAALLQYGYGSYGNSIDPNFNPVIISLLDRGMVYAIAHIRGGQEMGRAWYEDGKLLKKMNTFNDFIDVTDYLVAQGYASKQRVAAMGGSAGGLLMGAIANMAPEKYAVIISQVPFVDVVTTMLDASIPLTTNEYDEWGNPEDPTYYNYMLSYSPYDQLKAQDYPAMFVGTGLWDSQVQYFEPAKYVARLRALKTDSKPLVFRVNMEAGHGGKSGRMQKYREIAEYQAFALQQLGVAE